jgi:hypothetical protein
MAYKAHQFRGLEINKTWGSNLPQGWQVADYEYSCCCGSGIVRALVTAEYLKLVEELKLDLGDDDNGHEGWFDPSGNLVISSSWACDAGAVILYLQTDGSYEVEEYRYDSDDDSTYISCTTAKEAKSAVKKAKRRLSKLKPYSPPPSLPIPTVRKPAKKAALTNNAPTPKPKKLVAVAKKATPKPKKARPTSINTPKKKKRTSSPKKRTQQAQAPREVQAKGTTGREIIYQSATLVVYAD